MSPAITPRATRLVRTATLQSFRDAVISLACDGPPLRARDRLVVVPTSGAAAALVRSIERRRLPPDGSVVLPDIVVAGDLVTRLAARLPIRGVVLSQVEREVLLAAACRRTAASGHEPPFRMRPALVAGMLEFYDTLRRNRRDVASFERLALERLEPGADVDRGARRLVRQTRFLAAAFAEFERQSSEHGTDEHGLRQRLISEPGNRPYRHVVVTVSDRTFDPYGLHPADWDMLTRTPGLERLDVLATDRTLAGAWHERIHTLLPDIEEMSFDSCCEAAPVLVAADGNATVHVARDREEEIASFVRRVRHALRRGDAALDRMAFVVEQPQLYAPVAREVCRAAGVPCQMTGDRPLAGEPYAAAVDLVLAAVTTGFARGPSIELLCSPHFALGTDGQTVQSDDVAALDRALAEAGYAGSTDALERIVEAWRSDPAPGRQIRSALRAGTALLDARQELGPLASPAPVGAHLTLLLDFLARRDAGAGGRRDSRQTQARSAVRTALRTLRDAYARFDLEPVAFEDVAALVRRLMDAHVVVPGPTGTGVHVADAESARFGDFDFVQLGGLVDGEWPEPSRRSVFYSREILKDLGWSSPSERRDAARARFADLLRLATSRVVVSTFSLDGDARVSPSSLIDELAPAGLDVVEEEPTAARIFEHEALGFDPVVLDAIDPFARAWADVRLRRGDRRGPRFRGYTGPHRMPAYALGALERYQDCPFRFFSANVLQLEEAPEDEAALSPRARGRLVHELMQRFFGAWDARGGGAITPARLDEARRLFIELAEPMLQRLGEADRVLERMRLFGSALSVGLVDTVLDLEASRSESVEGRRLELRLEGAFSLGDGGNPVPLKGIADRIDLLPGRRLRVFDYKSGQAPDPCRALQAPIYALCAREQLEIRDGLPWTIDEAAYLVLTGDRPFVPVVKGSDGGEALDAARSRLRRAIDGIGGGEFPPRPHGPAMCRTCAFSTVCRQDFADDA